MKNKIEYKLFDTLNPDKERFVKTHPVEFINKLHHEINESKLNELKKSRFELLLKTINSSLTKPLTPQALLDKLVSTKEEDNNELQPHITKLLYNDLFDEKVRLESKKIQPNKWNLFIPYRIAPQRKINYTLATRDGIAGACEIWGKRRTQDDRIILDQTSNPKIENFSDETWETILRETVKELQDDPIITERPKQGSTLCTTIILKNKIINANLGDSESFLVRIKANGEVSLSNLHGKLHKPNAQGEEERINKAGGRVVGGTHIIVNGDNSLPLAMSGALGDAHFGDCVTHIPAIKHTEVNLKEGEQAFVITACDGLREGLAKLSDKPEDSICKLVKEHKDKTPENIAKALALKALDAGSTDNISVVVVPFKPDSNEQLFTTILDGNGGDQISDTLSRQYSGILQANITMMSRGELQFEFDEFPSSHLEVEQDLEAVAHEKMPLIEFNEEDIPITSNANEQLQKQPQLIKTNNVNLKLQNALALYQSTLSSAQTFYERTPTPTWFQEIVGAKGIVYGILSWFSDLQDYLAQAVIACNRDATKANAITYAARAFDEEIERISESPGLSEEDRRSFQLIIRAPAAAKASPTSKLINKINNPNEEPAISRPTERPKVKIKAEEITEQETPIHNSI